MSYLLNFLSLALCYDVVFHKSLPHEYTQSQRLTANDVYVEDILSSFTRKMHIQGIKTFGTRLSITKIMEFVHKKKKWSTYEYKRIIDKLERNSLSSRCDKTKGSNNLLFSESWLGLAAHQELYHYHVHQFRERNMRMRLWYLPLQCHQRQKL